MCVGTHYRKSVQLLKLTDSASSCDQLLPTSEMDIASYDLSILSAYGFLACACVGNMDVKFAVGNRMNLLPPVAYMCFLFVLPVYKGSYFQGLHS